MRKPPHVVEKRGVAAVLAVFWLGFGLVGTAGAEETLTLSRAECEALLAIAPTVAPTGEADYQPGRDVRGNPVPGADVAGQGALALPEEITFSIGLDLEKKYGIGSSGAYSGEGAIGTVTVRGGQVFWNDRPLDVGDGAVLRAACEAALAPQ